MYPAPADKVTNFSTLFSLLGNVSMLYAAKLMFGLEEARLRDFIHDNLILYNLSTHRKPRTELENTSGKLEGNFGSNLE